MKVLMVNYEFPPLGGGAGKFSRQLAAGLINRQVQVDFLTTQWGDKPAIDTKDGLKIYRVPSRRRYADRCSYRELLDFAVKARGLAVKLSKENHYDLAHVFFGWPGGPVGLELKKVAGLPYILSVRGRDVPGGDSSRSWLTDWMLKRSLKKIYREAVFVAANSFGLEKLSQSVDGKTRTVVIPNAVDTGVFCPPPVRRAARFKLLYVGRLRAFKGVAGLLEILKICSRQQDNIVFELAGSGEEEARIRKTAVKYGLADKVIFAGNVPYEEMPAHYREADVFVFPSRGEGSPNAVLEAMACGLPVVAANARGTNELVKDGETGFLTPVDNWQQMAEKILLLLRDAKLYERFSQAGQNKTAAYSWDEITDKYLKLYQEALRRA